MTNLPERPYLLPKEIAEYYAVSVKTVYGWIDQGKLDADRVAGRSIRIPRSSAMGIAKDVNA